MRLDCVLPPPCACAFICSLLICWPGYLRATNTKNVVACDSFRTAAFIDLTNFTTMEGAIGRSIVCITYLQKQM